MKEIDFAVRWFDQEFYYRWRVHGATRYEDGVLPRLRKDEINLFTPWGPRYSYETRGTMIQPNDKEVATIARLAQLARELRANMPGKILRWVFVGADVYGTNINHLPEEAVLAYFADLECRLRQAIPWAEFCLWSALAREAETYREEVQKNFNSLVSSSILERAFETAELMGRGGDARAYLVERLTEARLIEELLEPIKISCAPKRKDVGVDDPLPCLYLVPENIQAPWL